mgnify:FL=1
MYNVNHWINVPVDVEVFEEAKNVLEETIKLLEERNLGCAHEPKRMWALKGVLQFTGDMIDPNTSYDN